MPALDRDHEFRRGPKLSIITDSIDQMENSAARQEMHNQLHIGIFERADWVTELIIISVFFSPILLLKSDSGNVSSLKALKMSDAATRSVYKV